MQTIEVKSVDTISNCPLCGESLRENPNACTMCDWVKADPQNEAASLNRRDVAAALLSVAVPGLGHVYKGYTWLALLMLGGAAVTSAFAVAFFTIVFPIPASPLLLAGYWGFAAFHAYAAHDFNPPEKDIVWKMAAMLVAGLIGAALTIGVASHLLHFSV
jgi:hypothetical protein